MFFVFYQSIQKIQKQLTGLERQQQRNQAQHERAVKKKIK